MIQDQLLMISDTTPLPAEIIYLNPNQYFNTFKCKLHIPCIHNCEHLLNWLVKIWIMVMQVLHLNT